MAVVETVRHTGAVVHELHHVATKVGLLVDSHPVGAPVLWTHEKKERQGAD